MGVGVGLGLGFWGGGGQVVLGREGSFHSGMGVGELWRVAQWRLCDHLSLNSHSVHMNETEHPEKNPPSMDSNFSKMPNTADEPHGSLFTYFRIFAPLVDNHVIMSHVTGITQPIPTFADDLQ